jgi:hypothetical protein
MCITRPQMEAHASPLGTDYTRGLSQEAVGLILAHLPRRLPLTYPA